MSKCAFVKPLRCFAVSILAVLAVAASASAQETVLRITLQLPLTNHIGQNLLMFKEEVESASNGEIEVQIFDSAQLYRDSEVPQAVSSGAIEMGTASLTRYVGDIPAVDIFYVPFMFDSEPLVRAATGPDSQVRQLVDDAILANGARVLWWQPFGGSVFLSNDAPVARPDDLEGRRVRVFGRTLGNWIESMGGAPSLISGSEQFLAYQRGTVDIGMTGISGVQSRNLWDVMDTVTTTNYAVAEFIVVINEEFWESLPEDHRTIIETAARNAESAVRDEIAQIEAAAFDAASTNGMTIYQPTDAEMVEWRASAQPVIEDYLATAGDLGQQVYDAAQALREAN
ncbi:MAG: TRAP transporter substrate-binding protein DctP [Pseudomonadota bacterium]